MLDAATLGADDYRVTGVDAGSLVSFVQTNRSYMWGAHCNLFDPRTLKAPVIPKSKRIEVSVFCLQWTETSRDVNKYFPRKS